MAIPGSYFRENFNATGGPGAAVHTLPYQGDKMALDIAARQKALEQANAAARQQAGSHSMEMAERKFNLNQAKQEAKRKAADDEMLEGFGAAWMDHLGKASETFSLGLSSLLGVGDDIVKANGWIDQLGDVAGQLDAGYQQWQSLTSGLSQEAVDQSRFEIGERRRILGELAGSKVDVERAGDEAQTGVRNLTEQRKQALVRDLQSKGIDLNSAAAQRRLGISDNQMVLNMATAANVAEAGARTENRALGMGTLAQLDPTGLSRIASENAQTGADFLSQKGNILGAAAGAANDLARIRADAGSRIGTLASQYGQTVAQPLGEIAAFGLTSRGKIG
jgi:hypothetical protein